jgi:hypothetical protein
MQAYVARLVPAMSKDYNIPTGIADELVFTLAGAAEPAGSHREFLTIYLPRQ